MRRDLAVHPEAAKQVRDICHEHRCPTWGEDPVNTEVLLASELVTDAVRYAVAPSMLEVACRPPDDEGGRGMAIVEALSDQWGVGALPHGKAVWFRLVSERSSTPRAAFDPDIPQR